MVALVDCDFREVEGKEASRLPEWGPLCNPLHLAGDIPDHEWREDPAIEKEERLRPIIKKKRKAKEKTTGYRAESNR